MTEIIKLAENENLAGETLHRLAKAAQACKMIVFPTDTVYGLGSTGLIKAASRKIYQIKQRNALKPLPILVKSTAEAKLWAQWTPAADLLAEKFWPGALTLVLKPTDEGRILTFAEYPTIALRVPAHPVILALLEASDIPWVATSANISGKPPCADGKAAGDQFQGTADFVIDAGPGGGRESTLVDASALPVRILREGAISSADILSALKQSP